MTNPNHEDENEYILSRLSALAIGKSVEPEELRRLLVKEFTSDLLSQLQEYLRVTTKLQHDVALVSPQRGETLAEAFLNASPVLADLANYLTHLSVNPKDWPASQ